MKMKFLLYMAFAFLLSITIPEYSCSQSDDDKNIISYYAVGNSLDGQPLIDTDNALRFFPVFIFREKTESVKITAYIGSKIFSTYGVVSDDRSYWQANLPEFKFGEAIQRLEVETKISLDQERIEEFEKLQDDLNKSFISDTARLGEIRDNILKNLEAIKNNLSEIKDKDLNKNFSTYQSALDDNVKLASKLDSAFNNTITLITAIDLNNPDLKLEKAIGEIKKNQTEIETNFSAYSRNIANVYSKNDEIYQDLIQLKLNLDNLDSGSFVKSMKDIVENIVQKKLELDSTKNSLKKQLVEDMSQQFVDTNLSGPQVKESDIILDKDYRFVRILYRNYKAGLRQLPALDPGEKLGVFRIRYVPFPVVGNTLYRPFTEGSIAVFEVGLGFSNVTITGDDFVNPTLSADRLGIAFAITQKLFQSDAPILALVLTYDFNAYGSIGVGANFAYPDNNTQVKPYYSFGINKKAFEDLVVSIGKFFGAQ